jgi:hypothetical protein
MTTPADLLAVQRALADRGRDTALAEVRRRRQAPQSSGPDQGCPTPWPRHHDPVQRQPGPSHLVQLLRRRCSRRAPGVRAGGRDRGGDGGAGRAVGGFGQHHHQGGGRPGMTESSFETLTERLQRRSDAMSARRVRRAIVWIVSLALAAAAGVWAFLFGIEVLAQLLRLMAVLS